MINAIVSHVLEVVFGLFLVSILIKTLFGVDLVVEIIKLYNKIIYSRKSNDKDEIE